MIWYDIIYLYSHLTLLVPACRGILGYCFGSHAPGRSVAPGVEPYLAGHHMLLAHGRAAEIYRKVRPEGGKRLGGTCWGGICIYIYIYIYTYIYIDRYYLILWFTVIYVLYLKLYHFWYIWIAIYHISMYNISHIVSINILCQVYIYIFGESSQHRPTWFRLVSYIFSFFRLWAWVRNRAHKIAIVRIKPSIWPFRGEHLGQNFWPIWGWQGFWARHFTTKPWHLFHSMVEETLSFPRSWSLTFHHLGGSYHGPIQ